MVLRNRPQPAVIVTLQRTGGSFLAFCLSNHPEIFCTRGEPLAQRSYWVGASPDPVARLELILRQQYYAVSMCKLIDSHAFKENVWHWLTTQGPPVRVLYLVRENVLAQAVSHEINAGRREGQIHGHPTHAFETVNPPPVRLDPGAVLARCRSEAMRYVSALAKLKASGLPTMKLTYYDITGGRSAAGIPRLMAARICQFLRVPYAPLRTSMRKVHRRPLAKTVENWTEVERILRGTEFEKFLGAQWQGR